jgi:AcrR family transcriptional regulator
MTIPRRQVELLEKNRPRQERAKRTYEAILNAAAELLIEVGVERISTNLIAERAGITVPALYRYFPNKYAVINALGAGLMDRQNEVFQSWIESHFVGGDADLLSHIYDVLKMTYDVTLEQRGGLEIAQSLRAVGPLQELRLTSHNMVADQFASYVAELLQLELSQQIRLQARVTIESGYGIVEMALEDAATPPEETLRQGALMLEIYWRHIIESALKSD